MSHDPRSAGRSAGHAVGMRRGARSFRSTTRSRVHVVTLPGSILCKVRARGEWWPGHPTRMRRVGKRPDGDGANPMHRRTVHGRIRVLASALRISALVALAALFGTAGNLQADESALARLQAIAAAEQAAEKRRRDSQRARREYQRRSAAAHAQMRMQGVSTMHASTPSPRNGAMCLAPGVEPARFSSLPSGTSRTAGGSSTARAVVSSRNSASGTTQTTGTSSLGLRRSPQPHPILDSTTPHVPTRERRVPFLPSASREPAQRGILRLASHDSRATVVVPSRHTHISSHRAAGRCLTRSAGSNGQTEESSAAGFPHSLDVLRHAYENSAVIQSFADSTTRRLFEQDRQRGFRGLDYESVQLRDTQTFRPTGCWPMSHDPRSPGVPTATQLGCGPRARSFRSTTPVPASTS